MWSEGWLVALPDAYPLARIDLHGTDFDGQDVIVGHAERSPRCGRQALLNGTWESLLAACSSSPS
jgi:hypothetical protein